jgi:hypothetical protein
VKVRHEGTYEDGHEYDRIEEMDEPAELTEDWWEDEAWCATGDGHPGDACYTATIVEAADPTFVGQTREWIG